MRNIIILNNSKIVVIAVFIYLIFTYGINVFLLHLFQLLQYVSWPVVS